MRNTDHLTREQLREEMRKPLSPSAAERRRKAIEADRWLLAYNLVEMEKEESTHSAKKGGQ
jgi:hypothetical protein